MHPACRASLAWVEDVVVGLDLCPFAADVVRAGRVRAVACEAVAPEHVLAALDDELAHLLRTPVADLETTLVVLTRALRDFDTFNAFLDVAEELLRERGCEGVVQVASFHPGYRFAGEPEDDPANWTNRSPFPMLHLLREESVARAIEAFGGEAAARAIPERNAALLRAEGSEAMRARVAACLAANDSNADEEE